MNWDLNCSPKNILLQNGNRDSQLIDNIKEIVPKNIAWVVQENIQGPSVGMSYDKDGNFCFCVRPTNYKNLSNTFLLIENAVFKIKEKVEKLFKKSKAKNEIVVYGKIILSNNDNGDFFAFALTVDDEIQHAQQCANFFKKCNLPFVHMLLVAPLEQCLDFSLDINSQIKTSDQKNILIDEIIIQPESPFYDEARWRIILKKQK